MVTMILFAVATLIVGVGQGSTISNGNNFIVFIAIIMISIGFFYQTTVNVKLKRFQLALIVGYIMRIALLLLDLYGKSIYLLPNSGYDSEMYYRCAVNYLMTGDSGQGGMFSLVMGGFFSLAGTNRLYAQFTVMLFSIVSLCVLVYAVCEIEMIEESVRVRAVGLVALMPNFAILSSIFLRESIITMLLAVSLYFFIKWMVGGNELWFIGGFVIAFLAATFHSGSAAIAIGYIAARILYDHRKKEVHMRVINLIPAIIFIGIVAYLYINYADFLFEKMGNVNSIADIGSINTEGGSSYAAYVGNSSSIINMIVFTIPRIIYFLFSPFPWQWRNLGDIIAFLFSSLFYFCTIKNAVICIKNTNADNRKYTILILIVALCTVFVFSWGVTNTGTATRHRDKMIILYGVLYSLSHRNHKDKQIYLGKMRIL